MADYLRTVGGKLNSYFELIDVMKQWSGIDMLPQMSMKRSAQGKPNPKSII